MPGETFGYQISNPPYGVDWKKSQSAVRKEHDTLGFIDLVFHNIKLKCYVLIDLKTGRITHQDVGQMDMYVRIL